MKDFLRGYFSGLNQAELLYAVMRNYEGLPNYKIGNDIDIFVKSNELKAHLSLLLQISVDQGWVPIQVVKRPYIWVIKLIKMDSDFGSDSEEQVLHFDLFPGGYWYGFNFMPEGPALKRRVAIGDLPIYRLSDGDEVFHTIVHHTLYTGRIMKDVYIEQFRDALNDGSGVVQRKLQNIFGTSNSITLIDSILAKSQVDSHLQKKLRVALALKNIRSKPLHSTRIWFKGAMREFQQILNPPGLVVYVEGDKELIADTLHASRNWLEKINRLNHAIVSYGPFRVILPSYPTARARIKRHYKTDDGGILPSIYGRRFVRGRVRNLRRRGVIIVISGSELSGLKRLSDVVLELAPRNDSNLIDTRDAQAMLISAISKALEMETQIVDSGGA